MINMSSLRCLSHLRSEDLKKPKTSHSAAPEGFMGNPWPQEEDQAHKDWQK